MYYDDLLPQIQESIEPLFGYGKLADYIPALAKVDPKQFGIAVRTIDGLESYSGKAYQPFSIQSISKVFTLTLALQTVGNKIWTKVGKGSCETSFNAIAPLECEHGIPRNPLVNAGAIIIADALISHIDDPRATILDFVRTISGNENIDYDLEVSESEKQYGHRNAAIANFMKSYNMLENDICDVLDLYYLHCSIKMSCMDIARAVTYLANGGYCPFAKDDIISLKEARKINALLFICGMYNASGDFAFRIGLPGKSGVGGGIFAIVPNNLSICVWSPELDDHGNSLIGIKALEEFIDKTGLSVF